MDIETCPTDENDRQMIRMRIKKEMSDKGIFDENEMDALTDRQFRETALNGDHGRILCIGVISESRGRIAARRLFGYNKAEKTFSCDEKALLTDFWNLLKNFNLSRDLIVGHNVFDFDLLFLYKRSIINDIQPSVSLSFARYRS